MVKQKRTPRKSLKLPEPSYDRLVKLAERENLSLSRMMARAIATLWIMFNEEERLRAILAAKIYPKAKKIADDDSE